MPAHRSLGSLALIVLVAAAAACTAGEDVDSSEGAIKEGCVSEDALLEKGFDPAISAWLKSSATDLSDRPVALARMEQIVGDAKVVGFGEPDHGFHEFGAIRNDVFEMLVEKKDFRAITLETGIIEARMVERYVTDVNGKSGLTLDEVLAKGFTHDMGEWEETSELVKWVRAHNEAAAKSGKPLVHWGGKDLTVRGDTLTVPLAEYKPALEKLGIASKYQRLFTLSQKASEVTLFVEQKLRELKNVPAIDPDHLDAITSLSYDQLSDAERKAIGDDLGALVRELDSRSADHAKVLGKDDFEWARLMVRVAQQIHEDLEHRLDVGVVYGPTNTAGSTYTELKGFYALLGLPMPVAKRVKFTEQPYTAKELATYQQGRKIREEHLAENVDYLAKKFGKTFNFAASSHVQKARTLKDSGEAYAEGQFIEKRYGKGYVVIGGTASEFETPKLTGDARHDASAKATKDQREAQMARPGSFERRFENTAMSSMVVDLRKDPRCSRPAFVKDWLKTPQLTWIGTMKYDLVPADNYDALFWVRRATFGHRIARPSQK